MTSQPQPPPVRRPRHLLDPDDLHQSHRRTQGSRESLTRVQRWVMSVLAVTTMMHLAAGFVVGAVYMEASRTTPRIGLNALAAVIGVLAIVTARLIHGKPALSAWLLLGLAPAAVGFRIVLG